MMHRIKLRIEFADAVLSGDKCFEVRLNDRGYQKGDKVQFQVVDGSCEKPHPLDTRMYEITYVINGWGLKNGYVIFGIREVEE